jgi:hypothetical protein
MEIISVANAILASQVGRNSKLGVEWLAAL